MLELADTSLKSDSNNFMNTSLHVSLSATVMLQELYELLEIWLPRSAESVLFKSPPLLK